MKTFPKASAMNSFLVQFSCSFPNLSLRAPNILHKAQELGSGTQGSGDGFFSSPAKPLGKQAASKLLCPSPIPGSQSSN